MDNKQALIREMIILQALVNLASAANNTEPDPKRTIRALDYTLLIGLPAFLLCMISATLGFHYLSRRRIRRENPAQAEQQPAEQEQQHRELEHPQEQHPQEQHPQEQHHAEENMVRQARKGRMRWKFIPSPKHSSVTISEDDINLLKTSKNQNDLCLINTYLNIYETLNGSATCIVTNEPLSTNNRNIVLVTHKLNAHNSHKNKPYPPLCYLVNKKQLFKLFRNYNWRPPIIGKDSDEKISSDNTKMFEIRYLKTHSTSFFTCQELEHLKSKVKQKSRALAEIVRANKAVREEKDGPIGIFVDNGDKSPQNVGPQEFRESQNHYAFFQSANNHVCIDITHPQQLRSVDHCSF